ncbi:hypothetical protein [Neisseria weixii]|uniref:hypothetical protein n=1 Tax=Neisseria weixii TaxID=1853276 RepID=UPI0018DFDFF2|nr:hypothetical protein [Neisseria weixii]
MVIEHALTVAAEGNAFVLKAAAHFIDDFGFGEFTDGGRIKISISGMQRFDFYFFIVAE